MGQIRWVLPIFRFRKGDENVYPIDRGLAYTFYGGKTRVTDFEK